MGERGTTLDAIEQADGDRSDAMVICRHDVHRHPRQHRMMASNSIPSSPMTHRGTRIVTRVELGMHAIFVSIRHRQSVSSEENRYSVSSNTGKESVQQ